jgi:uncharacterized integral membrane protein
MADHDVTARDERAVRRRQTIRIVVIVLLVAVIVAFAIDNSQEVEVGYVVDSTTWPLWTVIVGFSVVGLIVGYVAGRRHE